MSAPADAKRGRARRSARRAEQSAPPAFSLPARALSYALALFLGSTLLFLLEPIAAKRLVPLLGGSAAVWTTCLVFFQTALLLGYYVAHLLVTRTTRRTQVTAYVGLLALSVVQLVRVVDPSLQANAERPIVSVLWLLTGLIGLPFVTLSATSPLLQAWFARTTPRGRADAYGLFAISNFGSIVALLAYPWLIEPRLTLRAQTILVAIVLAMLAILAGVIGASVSRGRGRRAGDDDRNRPASRRPPACSGSRWPRVRRCSWPRRRRTSARTSRRPARLDPSARRVSAELRRRVHERAWPPRWLVVALAIVGLLVSADLLYRGVFDVPIPLATATFYIVLFLLCLFLHSELYHRRPAPTPTHVVLFSRRGGRRARRRAGRHRRAAWCRRATTTWRSASCSRQRWASSSPGPAVA